MAIHSRWDAERNVLFVTFEGSLADEDLVKYAHQATGDANIPSGHDELVDLRGAEEGNVNSHTLQQIADLFTRGDKSPEQSRVAIVAERDIAYGLSRMYQAFRSDSPLDLRVFREMNEARAWLGLDPE